MTTMFASVAAVGLGLFAAQVAVEGSTSCPSPALVASRLASLLPGDGVNPRPDQARLWIEDQDLVIRLRRADGVLLGTRVLPRKFGCEDLAAAAAVSLADWESDLHPEFSPRLEGVAPPPASSAPGLVLQRPASSRSSSSPWRFRVGLAAGLGGGLEEPAISGDATVGVSLGPAASRTLMRAELEGQSEQEITLRRGSAAWRRWTLGVGVERSFFAGPGGAAEGRLGWFALGRVAWLDLHGHGFALNRSDGALDPGIAAGLRMVTSRGRWSPLVELAASVWPVRHDIEATGLGNVGSLPAGDVFLRVGIAMTSWR